MDELTKPMVSGRHSSGKDMILNGCGAVLGVLIWILVGAG